MTGRELIEKLSERDLDLEVYIPCSTGGTMPVYSVDEDTVQSFVSQEFDRQVILLS